MKDELKTKDRLIAELAEARRENFVLKSRLREIDEDRENRWQVKFAEFKMAEELREEIFRITRHDMKTPLTGIIGICECLKNEENLTADQRRVLQMLQNSGAKMLDMINVSLALHKIERDAYVLDARRLDLFAVIRQVLEELKKTILQKKIDVRLRLDGRAPGRSAKVIIHGEELLCYAMMANLVKNALEASPKEGEIQILLTTDGQLGVEIVNSGCVPEDVRDRFFEKYATSGKRCGTGLGTYSAKLIAEAHGGEIEMQSCGETVSVKVTLPVPVAAMRRDRTIAEEA